MVKNRVRGVMGIMTLAAVLGVAAPVAAQSNDLSTPRVGAALTFADGGGKGVTGGVVYPLKDYGEFRSLGLVAAGQFLSFEGYGQLSFGGGLRWTRLLETVTALKKFRVYAQGVYGISRVLDDDFGSTDRGFTVGGGVGFGLTDRVDAFGQVNIARISSPEFDFSYSGYVILLGVSVPFGAN